MFFFLFKIHSDLQPFVDLDRHRPGTPFDLTSAPVVLHTQKAKEENKIEEKSEENECLADLVRAAEAEKCDFGTVSYNSIFIIYFFILHLLLYIYYIINITFFL